MEAYQPSKLKDEDRYLGGVLIDLKGRCEMKKLSFIIWADDGILEARDNGTKYHYTIFQVNELCRAVVWPWEPTEVLCEGDLYECLDACNKHYTAALAEANESKMANEKEPS